MDRLKNKVAIITGATQGMGAADAKLFIEEGAKVVITTAHNTQRGEELAAELGENALFIKQDVASETDWKNVIKETISHFGKVDVVVNNAGITFNQSIFDLTVEEYRNIVAVNQVSVFLGTKYGAEAMKEHGGSIINISSLNGLVGGAIGYTDTKFAVRGLTKAAALELSRYKIRVNSVMPGAVATPMIQQDDNTEAVAQFAKMIPMQRIANPDEVAQMVLFLASDESSYSTGADFVVDGGMSAR